MRTLSTQVRLRRLVRAFSESLERLLAAEPVDRQLASSVVLRLQELAEGVREAWGRESRFGPSEPSLERFGDQSLHMIDLAIAGLGQAGADLRLLQGDFMDAALPLELFLRGLDVQPALQRSA
jgi:uncharacterized protein YbjT (DUF2867 family)